MNAWRGDISIVVTSRAGAASNPYANGQNCNMPFTRTDALIPLDPNQAVDEGWTAATDHRPLAVTWHWSVTADLALCRSVLGGGRAERRGIASAHFGIGRSFKEGVDRYVTLDNRSWHAGVNQTLQWDGRRLVDQRFKATRTSIGVETVSMGCARHGYAVDDNWLDAAEPDGQHMMRVQPWTSEQVDMMIAIGKEIIDRWPNIGVRNHHGHHDICPGYKRDVAAFPFARVLRGIYDDPSIPDVWAPVWMPKGRQQALLALGYDLGPTGADGEWGRMSDTVLRDFQRNHGAEEDGMWTTFVSWKMYDAVTAGGCKFADW